MKIVILVIPKAMLSYLFVTAAADFVSVSVSLCPPLPPLFPRDMHIITICIGRAIRFILSIRRTVPADANPHVLPPD